MGKKRLVARGVIFGYLGIGAQILYSFASIPLALAYLSKAEFGMWSLISTIAGYLMLAEMGMTNSFMRHLFDCKDGQDSAKYGRIFTASAITLGILAALVSLLGIVAANFASYLFPIPDALRGSFFNLMLGQAIIMSIVLATRMIGAPFYVHHRQDLGQINQIGLFAIYYLVLHFGFKAGWGIYSMLANQVAGIIWSLSFDFFNAKRLGFYPSKGTWKLPTREEWLSVYRHSKDIFVIQISGLLLMSIPQLLVVRLLGLEAGATWAVCTRPFSILRQLLIKPFDVALPVLCDNYVKGHMRLVTSRWREVTQVVLAISGAAFAVAAANNSYFISLWTNGRIHWSEGNNWLLAFYFYTYTVAHLAYGTIGLDKKIDKSRYAGLIQAVLAVAIGIPLTKLWGLTGMIVAVSLPFLPGMIFFGVRHLASITKTAEIPLAWRAIVRPTMAVPAAMFAAWSCSRLSNMLPGYFGFILSVGTGTVLAMIAMLYLGIPRELRLQIFLMASGILRKFLPSKQASVS